MGDEAGTWLPAGDGVKRPSGGRRLEREAAIGVTDTSRSRERRASGGWVRSLRDLGWEGCFAVLILAVGAGLFADIEMYGLDAGAIPRVLWLSAYFLAGCALFYRFKGQWLIWSTRRLWPMGIVLVVALASVLWSVEPALTARRAVALVGSTLFGVYLGYNFAPRVMMGILFWTFASLIIASIIAVVIFPELGVTYYSHGFFSKAAWKGITSNKNTLGWVAAVTAIYFLVGTWSGRIGRPWGIPLAGTSLLTLVMTSSATAVVMFTAGAGVVGCFSFAKWLRFPSAAMLVLLLIGMPYAAFLVSMDVEQFTALLARSDTLTGRTAVWADALKIIAERPLTGYGYGAVWGLGAESYFPHLESTTESWAVNAHNGFLDLATQVGLPATAIAAAGLLWAMFLSVQGLIRRSSPFAFFAASYVFMFFIGNIAETHFYVQNLISWVIFVTIVVALLRITDQREGQGQRRHLRRSHSRRKPQQTRHTTAMHQSPLSSVLRPRVSRVTAQARI